MVDIRPTNLFLAPTRRPSSDGTTRTRRCRQPRKLCYQGNMRTGDNSAWWRRKPRYRMWPQANCVVYWLMITPLSERMSTWAFLRFLKERLIRIVRLVSAGRRGFRNLMRPEQNVNLRVKPFRQYVTVYGKRRRRGIRVTGTGVRLRA